MKKMMMLVAACMLSLVGVAQTTESLKIANFEITAGESKTVTMELTSDNEYVAFQCDMVLPEGLTVPIVEIGELGEMFLDAELNSVMKSRYHNNFAAQKIAGTENLYRFICFSYPSTNFRQTSGPLVDVVIEADANLPAGELIGTIKEVRFANKSAEETLFEETTFVVNGTGTGINEITTGGAVKQIYTLDGKQVKTAQKGVNIIRQADGTVQKVRVK